MAKGNEAQLLAKTFRGVGYRVALCTTSAMAAAEFQQLPFLAAVMDASMSDVNVAQLSSRLRESGCTTPLLALCDSNHYQDRVALLDAGADDVISRPYAIEELLARLRVWQRRSSMGHVDAAGDLLCHKDLILNTETREVQRAGTAIKLSVKEYDLLLFLLRHAGQVQERQRILEAVWGENFFGDANILEVYIRYLRKKIERPDLEPLIQTIRGVGYLLN
ncbi:response regulator transcription factor [Synechococcus sp. CBW1002]|uniref:response regulator transcription factor n=1 Tax=unclassified Synechococcus TaxID=2626047 RepID=UPI0018CCA6CA|nr:MULTISPECIES: response regulator transcription factor [unclassified Synechococcus]QPN59195.1 response regulator transcription factor [Synechococcus sp. CBW1002]QPN65984.1 response regulator transcription factor [Synechococcus sp. CBW1006]